MKSKSPVCSALQSLGFVKGSEQYSTAYGTLHGRANALRKLGKPVTVKALTAKPIKERRLSRTPLTTSSLTELFDQEAETAEKLEEIRKEITDVLKKGIGEARRRKIDVEQLVSIYGGAVARHDEGRNEGGQKRVGSERGVQLRKAAP